MDPTATAVPDGTGWSAPFTCHCGAPAVGQLVYIWDADNSEHGRSRPKCQADLNFALALWDQIKEVHPEALGGLRVLVTAP